LFYYCQTGNQQIGVVVLGIYDNKTMPHVYDYNSFHGLGEMGISGKFNLAENYLYDLFFFLLSYEHIEL
jgi:hypothetical protein